MNTNVGSIDRVIRIVIGLVVLRTREPIDFLASDERRTPRRCDTPQPGPSHRRRYFWRA